ncbi:two-component system, cell cycle sensor histidine kinase and response regulator CckA [Ketogulonicigenium robustum]|uniref:histidine kinase n=1 Tax=Ketogulonicigenium robustum TaxID=92947 RepID=A0A1W6NZH2_9RHOB|nr:ATP-binding protein [Ketogulonicigenium robustum]ARO14656.1 two-component system, cell cycle sensor histidine kinase and response regulator CckA [Ketogulonicigenium robustum]
MGAGERNLTATADPAEAVFILTRRSGRLIAASPAAMGWLHLPKGSLSHLSIVDALILRLPDTHDELRRILDRAATLRGGESIWHRSLRVTRLPFGRLEWSVLPQPAHTTAPSQPSASIDRWQVAQGLPVPLLLIDLSGQIQAANSAATTLLGQDIPSGTATSDVFEGLGRPMLDWLREVHEGRALSYVEFLKSVREDRFFQVRLSDDRSILPEGVLAILEDVTELKLLEEQFLQSQKMQAVGQLAGGIAHDFNNLLTAISGHCDLLLLRHDRHDTSYADLMQIHHNANRAAALVRQLLAFSRKQSLTIESVAPDQTVSEVAFLLRTLLGERAQLALQHDDAVSKIRVDRRQLEQALVNLAVNARDAAPSGGQITITTRNMTLSAPLLRDRARVPIGDYVAITVEDNGTGIPANILDKIFEPFFTTKRVGEGTGLGLSMVYGFVKQSGGYIFVDSGPDARPAGGTCFTLMFPAEAAPEDDALPPNPTSLLGAAMRPTGNHTVLVVEDEAPVRAFASRALRLSGLEVLEADSAEAALNLLQDPDMHIDLIISDVIMPGLNGPAWVQQALEHRPGTRVILISGYAEESFDEHRAAIPNCTFLPKPFSLAGLVEAVNLKLAD